MGITTVLSPIAMSVYDSGWGEITTSTIAMTWMMNTSPWGLDFRFDPFTLFASLPFTFLRIVFAIMMLRLYQGKTTRKRTVVIGIASELQLILIFYVPMLLTLLLFPTGYFSFQLILPIPILIGIGLIIMKLSPPTEQTMWIEEEKSSSWWEKQDEEPAKTTAPPKDKAEKSKEPESPW